MRRTWRRYEEEPKEELRAYFFWQAEEIGMPIVVNVLVVTTNGIPGAAQVLTSKDKMVGVVEFLLATGCAPTSTVLTSGGYSLGSVVADFSLAAGFAPTPFPWLPPRESLADASTTYGDGIVSGVA